MKEHPWGLFPWTVLVIALVVPNPFKLALDPVDADDTASLALCSVRCCSLEEASLID